MASKKKGLRHNASNWEKLSARGSDETFENRDVYGDQQLDRDKLGDYNTVADLIAADWEFPEFEVQRPAGAYVVDTAPVNTMVLAITRAGKGPMEALMERRFQSRVAEHETD